MRLDIDLIQNRCESCGREDIVYSANITHNLCDMAEEAGIYGVLWHPTENAIGHACQLVSPLLRAIVDMRTDPERFKAFNSPNGWGTYATFLPWLGRLLDACRKYPGARVVSDT